MVLRELGGLHLPGKLFGKSCYSFCPLFYLRSLLFWDSGMHPPSNHWRPSASNRGSCKRFSPRVFISGKRLCRSTFHRLTRFRPTLVFGIQWFCPARRSRLASASLCSS